MRLLKGGSDIMKSGNFMRTFASERWEKFSCSVREVNGKFTSSKQYCISSSQYSYHRINGNQQKTLKEGKNLNDEKFFFSLLFLHCAALTWRKSLFSWSCLVHNKMMRAVGRWNDNEKFNLHHHHQHRIISVGEWRAEKWEKKDFSTLTNDSSIINMHRKAERRDMKWKQFPERVNNPAWFCTNLS